MNGEDRPKAVPTQRPIDDNSGSGGQPRLRRLDVRHMVVTDPPPIPWVVENFAIEGCLTLLAGRPGEGKSLFTQALALAAIASRRGKVAGLTVEGGRALIVDAENGPDEIHRRVRALGIEVGDDSRLEIAEADGFHLGHDLRELEALVAEVKPHLLILDGFRSLWRNGDENDSGETSQVLGQLRDMTRRRRVASILIHHSPRRGATYRGSGAIAASAELVFVLERLDGDEDPQRRRLRCEKCRPASEPPPRWLRLATAAELASGGAPIQEAAAWTAPASERTTKTEGLIPQILELVERAGPLKRAEIARGVGLDGNNGTLGRALAAALKTTNLTRRADQYEVASHNGNVAGTGVSGTASQPATPMPVSAGTAG